VAQEAGEAHLLGPADPFQRACWEALDRVGRATAAEVATGTALAEPVVSPVLHGLVARRVAIPVRGGALCSLSFLSRIGND